jgi:hypothetical protein
MIVSERHLVKVPSQLLSERRHPGLRECVSKQWGRDYIQHTTIFMALIPQV